MPVYRLDLSYDGAGFNGYARQEGQPTVQGRLEEALAAVIGAPVITSVAGRTDTGVHARGQVVSFSWPGDLDTKGVARSLRGILGPEIVVTSVAKAGDDFDARFSAVWRRYRYLIDPAPAPDPLLRHQVWHVGRALNVDAMAEVAAAFVGEHDFSSFCRAHEGRGNVRRVFEAGWRDETGLLAFWIRASAYCHQMVRSLVGYCYDVGRGFSDPEAVSQVFEARDRSAVATVAPPHGLILWDVGY